MNKPIVVITGASAGVGRATAIEFASKGWRVALLWPITPRSKRRPSRSSAKATTRP